MSSKVGAYLRHDPIKLRFTTTNTDGSAKSTIKRSLNQSVAELIGLLYSSPSPNIILYEMLDVSIIDLETKRSLEIIWTGICNREEGTFPFLMPKTSMVLDLISNLAEKVTLTPRGSGRIRVFQIKDGKKQEEFADAELVGNLPDPVQLYAEVGSF